MSGDILFESLVVYCLGHCFFLDVEDIFPTYCRLVALEMEMKEDNDTYRSEGLWLSWTLSSKATHACTSASLLTYN